jgi:hypothetical protein
MQMNQTNPMPVGGYNWSTGFLEEEYRNLELQVEEVLELRY